MYSFAILNINWSLIMEASKNNMHEKASWVMHLLIQSPSATGAAIVFEAPADSAHC